MLEFIVLGHIPGTDIYLSFVAVAIITIDILFTVGVFKVLGRIFQAHFRAIQTKYALVVVHTI